ncbi:MAG TPA: helix-turn-helix domain-containing protein [Bryobacteraceae bacterium]|nr:helix-turn-helix domain-containing protein [Bryobacteraceae bacterium]
MYREQAPSRLLSDWVECAWSFETGSAVEGRVPPDGCVDILYDREKGLRVIGAMTVEQRYDHVPGTFITGVRFRPGMAGTFLGASPAELTDGSVSLDDLWPRRSRDLQQRLDDAMSIRDAMRLLIDSVAAPESAPSPVQRAIDALTLANGNADLDALARHANLSPRQFRRRVLEESGLTPKHLARVLRFRHACQIARAAGRRPDWAVIALDAGYFDQSHFIRDFREFTGRTPVSLSVSVLSNTSAA